LGRLGRTIKFISEAVTGKVQEEIGFTGENELVMGSPCIKARNQGISSSMVILSKKPYE
jgi:hypothetical protein